MTPETKKYIKLFCENVIAHCNFVKTTDVDQFTIMRISLIYSLADQIYKHLEV